LSNQCLLAVVSSVSAILIFFAGEVLLFWTGDARIVEKAATPLAILVAGTGLNGILNLPYALQLAHGWTRLTIASNACALVLGIPFCIWATHSFGMPGAALLWLMVNLCNFLVVPALTHKRLLPEATISWYQSDVLPALAAATVTAFLCHLAIPSLHRTPSDFALLALASAITLLASVLSLKETRQLLYKFLPI
jgi:hypothetical protein